jgi:hypothetical protein
MSQRQRDRERTKRSKRRTERIKAYVDMGLASVAIVTEPKLAQPMIVGKVRGRIVYVSKPLRDPSFASGRAQAWLRRLAKRPQRVK